MGISCLSKKRTPWNQVREFDGILMLDGECIILRCGNTRTTKVTFARIGERGPLLIYWAVVGTRGIDFNWYHRLAPIIQAWDSLYAWIHETSISIPILLLLIYRTTFSLDVRHRISFIYCSSRYRIFLNWRWDRFPFPIIALFLLRSRWNSVPKWKRRNQQQNRC